MSSGTTDDPIAVKQRRPNAWGDPKRSDPVTVHAHTGDPANEASLI